MSLYLSKSKYCAGVQCPKMLWLRKNKPELAEPLMNQAVLDAGNKVGDLAMGLFGAFTEVPFGDAGEMIAATNKLLAAGEGIITEASFSYDGLFCSVDILKNLGNNTVELYEVKSSTEVKPVYLDDVAYQYYVLTKLGFNVAKACVVHINNKYVRHGDLELDKLFTIVDVSLTVRGKQQEVENNIAIIDKYLKEQTEPAIDIGAHCTNPYGCEFFPYCTRHLPKPNVFNLRATQFRTKLKHYANGIHSFQQLLEKAPLSPKQKLQVIHELFQQADTIDKDAIKGLLDKFTYPLYFLDFETFNSAIPLFDNAHPYEQIVFQYSLHYIEKADGDLKHKEYLAYPGSDPRRALAEQLCQDIPKDTCIVAYNSNFEKMCIKGLAELYPDLAEHLMNLHANFVDLMIPFENKSYYNKAMAGSYSIKFVLPALFPHDPELDYHNLKGVQNGMEASNTFALMSDMDKDELERYRGYLLKYCQLDTYAMVKIWQKLLEITQ